VNSKVKIINLLKRWKEQIIPKEDFAVFVDNLANINVKDVVNNIAKLNAIKFIMIYYVYSLDCDLYFIDKLLFYL